MVRARGNARKKKTRLTERSLSSVMEMSGPRQDERVDGATLDPEPVVASILELLRAEPDVTVMPAIYNDASRVFTGANNFPTQRYVFGLAVCPQCHNDMIYYQDRDVLADGYRFRCRICQHELLASVPS